MSNRLEELPGPEAFHMDLGAVIGAFYARAGMVYLNNGARGAVTFIGTVSPAGGNLREPVTENTKRAARAFYALAQSRADGKRYPAVDPVDSYSKYWEYPEVQESLTRAMGPQWVEYVQELRDWVIRGREVQEQINILGDDGVPLDSHVVFWKAETVDFALMQQDAFDPIDSLCPLERQRYMLELVRGICSAEYKFGGHEEVAPWFKQVINVLRQMNYTEFESEAFRRYEQELAGFVDERRAAA
jgi:V/A-type H+-transporting ATPase subunit A